MVSVNLGSPLRAGADDYITKPIKPKLLVSKVKALLRRYREIKNDGVEITKCNFNTIIFNFSIPS